MAIKKTQQGFALLISIIFMSVMLSFGLTLGALAYKQQILASNAVESQYAFYAADAALECALYADQQQNLFDYTSHNQGNPPAFITTVACDSIPSVPAVRVNPSTDYSYTASQLVDKQRLSLDAGKHCADVTIYKPAPPIPPAAPGRTYLFSQGYNVSCTSVAANGGGARFVSRGLNASY